MADKNKLSFFLIHGVALWSVWTFFSLFQLVTARYFKHQWKVNRVLHMLSGSVVLCATLFYGLVGLYQLGGEIKIDAHGPLALTFTSLTAVLALSGVFAYMRLQNSDENQSRMLLFKKIHQVSSSEFVDLIDVLFDRCSHSSC